MCLLRAEPRGLSANAVAPWLPSKSRTHDLLSSGQINDKHNAREQSLLYPSSWAMYSASVVDHVTHLWVILSSSQLMTTPPRVPTIPDTDRFSLDLSV